MAFENLLNQPDDELELLRKVVKAIQAEFRQTRQNYHYLKLKKADKSKSEISGLKSLCSGEEFLDQIIGARFEHARISARPCGDHIRVVLVGFSKMTTAKVFSDRVEFNKRVLGSSVDESKPALGREIVEDFFRDLRAQMARFGKRSA